MVESVWKKIICTDRTFIIAEAGVNHNGSLEKAMELVDVAVDSGVDAIKFQTFKADRLVIPGAKKAKYQYCVLRSCCGLCVFYHGRYLAGCMDIQKRDGSCSGIFLSCFLEKCGGQGDFF